MRLTALLLGLFACAGPSIDDTEDTEEPVVTDTDRDTEPVPEDLDGDGVPSDEDCNDLDPDVYPGAPEILWNGKDDDCDGRTDADGRFEGSAAVTFMATVEGVTSRWLLTCPMVAERARVRVSFDISCEPPPGDPLARQVMGEQFTISERSNVAEEAILEGDIVVESSDGWSVQGSGQLRFTSADAIAGGFSMRSVFARSSGTFEASFVE